jgi:archaemetzincin
MEEKPAIVLAPIGPLPAGLLDHLPAPLSATFGRPCRVVASISIPARAYDRKRGQYVGRRILVTLARLPVPNAERVLGVIDADCYAAGLNFILGQASLHGRDAFIALARLRQSFYGLPEDEALFRERAFKEAVHELGHTYGLHHCPNPRCVMHFSNRLHDTDVKGSEFCSRCRLMNPATGRR